MGLSKHEVLEYAWTCCHPLKKSTRFTNLSALKIVSFCVKSGVSVFLHFLISCFTLLIALQVLCRIPRTFQGWPTSVSTCCFWALRSTPKRTSTASFWASMPAAPTPSPVESTQITILTYPMSIYKGHWTGKWIQKKSNWWIIKESSAMLVCFRCWATRALFELMKGWTGFRPSGVTVSLGVELHVQEESGCWDIERRVSPEHICSCDPEHHLLIETFKWFMINLRKLGHDSLLKRKFTIIQIQSDWTFWKAQVGMCKIHFVGVQRAKFIWIQSGMHWKHTWTRLSEILVGQQMYMLCFFFFAAVVVCMMEWNFCKLSACFLQCTILEVRGFT